MAEPLEISVLDRTDTQDFEQLMYLLKKFTIDTYIRNKPEFSELRGSKKFELVNNAISEFGGESKLSILTGEDIEQLKKDIDSQINSAKELIDNRTNGNTETRYYILKDGDKMVSFQQVQLANRKENNRIEGWRNLAYIEQEYSGERGQVIDSRGALQEGLYSEIIYKDIGQWFEENGVNYERTCTGVNMLPNILAYVRAKGFLPFSKNEKIIFLEKFKDNKVDRTTLIKAYKLYCKHRQRSEHKDKNDILEEIQSTDEFEELTKEQKQGLVECFLKEEEKEFEIPPEKMALANRFIAELQQLGMEVEINDIPQLIDSNDERVKKAKEKIMLFGEQEIGEATINTPTVSKDHAQNREQRDEYEIQQLQENQQGEYLE